MIRGVIFDLGNTLMYWDGEERDIDQEATAALIDFLGHNNISVSAEFPALLRAAREDGWQLSEKEEIEYTVEQALETALKHEQVTVQDGLLTRAVEAFFKSVVQYQHAYPESIQALEDLQKRELKLGLISNADDDGLVQRCVIDLGLGPYLDPIISSAGLRWRKPNPDIFRYVAGLWQLPPEQIVMVGDVPKYDILGAHRCGMRGILVNRNEGYWWQKIPDELAQDPAIQPDATITSLLEIPDIIACW